MGDPTSNTCVSPTDAFPRLTLPTWLTDAMDGVSRPEEAVSRMDPADEDAARESTAEPASVAWWTSVTVAEWQQKAMAAAGIDPGKWDPSKGFEANRENIKKVYALYAQWFLDNPELKWAGMAKLAGGSVYAGLENLIKERPSYGLRDIVVPILIYDKGKRVQMQKNIFMDMAWQHQAYVEGGLSALGSAYARGDLSAAEYEAWTKIASGDAKQVWAGNHYLLLREQSEILPPDYERINDMWGGGTIASQISDNTQSPIPGGASFRSLYPDGDVTDLGNRWRWIEDHMLPEYKSLGEAYTRTLVNQPLEELAERKFAPRP
jgi:hypothetical protein